MASRTELQTCLQDLLGSNNVYYQSPEGTKMKYPAIRYSKSNIKATKANNTNYKLTNCYEIIVMDTKPDNPVINKLLELPYCAYSRNYKADGLNHDVFTLYF